jgi:hypothetical protein
VLNTSADGNKSAKSIAQMPIVRTSVRISSGLMELRMNQFQCQGPKPFEDLGQLDSKRACCRGEASSWHVACLAFRAPARHSGTHILQVRFSLFSLTFDDIIRVHTCAPKRMVSPSIFVYPSGDFRCNGHKRGRTSCVSVSYGFAICFRMKGSPYDDCSYAESLSLLCRYAGQLGRKLQGAIDIHPLLEERRRQVQLADQDQSRTCFIGVL